MTWQGVIDALPVAVPAFVIALLPYLRSRQVDAAAIKSGVAANGRAGTTLLIDNLQEDNKGLRDENRLVTTERDALKIEVARLRKRYGENGEGSKV